MRASLGILCWAILASAQSTPPPAPAPIYVESSIVNAAHSGVERLAPNTIATVYGNNLAYVTRAIRPTDIQGTTLPLTLSGTGVKVMVGKVMAPILYVSPGQINFVVPSNLLPGDSEVQVGLDSRFGRAVRVRIDDVAPALFPLDPEFAVATHADGSVITREAPARGGEVIVLYATGLGQTSPRTPLGQIVQQPSSIARMWDFRVIVGNWEIPREDIQYAGTTAGFAGLYQVNIKLPDFLERDPEIRIGFGDILSPADVRLIAE